MVSSGRHSSFFPVFLYRWESEVSFEGWAYILASGVVHTLVLVYFGKSLLRSRPLINIPNYTACTYFCTFMVWLVLQARMNVAGITGVIIVVFGAYFLKIQGISLKYFRVVWMGTINNRSIRMAWLTALLVAIYSIIDDQEVEIVDPIFCLYTFYLIGFVAYVTYIFGSRRGYIHMEWKVNWRVSLGWQG